MHPDSITDWLRNFSKKYDLPHIHPHAFRHSCATIHLHLGYTMKDIQMWLGHSNYSFTANTYVHVSKDSHIQMAQSFSEKLPELGGAVMDMSEPPAPFNSTGTL